MLKSILRGLLVFLVGLCLVVWSNQAGVVLLKALGIFMILSAFILGKDFSGKDAFRIFKRDRYNHKSPNSAQTESVCAGALGLQLAGDAYYFGKLVKKPYIGDATREIEPEDIKRACKLMLTSATGTVLLACAISATGTVLLAHF